MRITHREIQTLASDLREWVASKKSATRPFMRTGYAGATRLGIYKFHRERSSRGARDYLNQIMDRYGLTNGSRRGEAQHSLSGYIQWWGTMPSVFVQDRLRLGLDLGNDDVLGGVIPRIDFDPSDETYNGIMLGEIDAGWKGQLRTPILQAAIAQRLNRDTADVYIGVQALDGTSFDAVQFSSRQIDDAIEELQSLIGRAKRLLAR